ncbi:MAG TPA: hypothetical protein VN456_03005 [Desulfosporosinus sp.]|nr:hypothetical protein [Desulfosporosinus sp.]
MPDTCWSEFRVFFFGSPAITYFVVSIGSAINALPSLSALPGRKVVAGGSPQKS